MSHPFIFARTHPAKPAVIMADSGIALTYRELEERANQHAHLFRSLGILRGDCVAAMLENGPDIFVLAWAAFRSGVYFTAISTRLTRGEINHILHDSGARAFFTSESLADGEADRAMLEGIAAFRAGGADGPYRDWHAVAAAMPITPISDESAGDLMLYSSGTTGQPKGVRRPLTDNGLLVPPLIGPILTNMFKVGGEEVYLCPAPLYHAAPLGWTTMMHRLGCTVVVIEKFDPQSVLQAIERYRVTMGQFVPTHFVRMLKLPEEVRRRYDMSSLKLVFHAGAPCPVPVKEAMIDWWGPILWEYYSGTEANGFTLIGSEEWLTHKGSVGRAIGCEVFACDEAGEPLPPGESGMIYFSGGPAFEYHNDPDKTAESMNARGWSCLGDIGHVDEAGFLYLSDRKSFMIISGGVNIYPQEIENLLVTHPKILDAAVIGAPDAEMGEKVVAVIQLVEGMTGDPALAEELRLFCREHLSGVKTPRQFDFVEELPRHPTGKLYKRLLRDRYWAQAVDA